MLICRINCITQKEKEGMKERERERERERGREREIVFHGNFSIVTKWTQRAFQDFH